MPAIRFFLYTPEVTQMSSQTSRNPSMGCGLKCGCISADHNLCCNRHCCQGSAYCSSRYKDWDIHHFLQAPKEQLPARLKHTNSAYLLQDPIVLLLFDL